MITRRDLIVGLLLATATRSAWARALAQQSLERIPRVGILSAGPSSSPRPGLEAFRQGLRELGYVEDRDIILEYRFSSEDFIALPRLAEELARLPVDVIVTIGGAAIAAASKATRAIPIVMWGGDLAAIGLDVNLARPGGNITGFSVMDREIVAKRVDLVRTAFPDSTSLTVLVNPSNAILEAYFRLTADAARSLGLSVTRVEAPNADALRALNPEALGQPGTPLIVLSDWLFDNHRPQIIALAAAARTPAFYNNRTYVDEGGLISYGANLRGTGRLAAGYVDRILKGTKPGDLPIQQPTRFELVVNLKTAKELGVTIPSSILARTDEVIE